MEFLCALKQKAGKLLGMSSFKKAWEMHLLDHEMKVINEQELLLLLDDNTERNLTECYCYNLSGMDL